MGVDCNLFRSKLVIFCMLILCLAQNLFAAEYSLMLSYLPFKGSLYLETTETFGKLIPEATNGKVEVVLNDSLFKGTELAQSVRDNLTSMSSLIAAYYSATNPEFGLAQLPGLMNNLDEFKAVFYGFWRQEMNRVFAEKYNSRVLAWALFSPQNLLSIRPIKTVEDFRGKKIRVHNIETATLVSTLGAKPTPMPGSEVLPALQRGIIDGVFTASAWAYGQAFYTVTKHTSLWPISTIIPFPIIINADEWQKLPKQIQDQITGVGQKLETDSFNNYQKNIADLPGKWAAKGAGYYEAPESEIALLFKKEHIQPVYKSFFDRTQKVGIDGRKFVKNAEKILGKNLGFKF